MNALNFSTANSEQLAHALGGRLEQIRLSRNLTQSWLAQEAGVSERTIRNLEKGEGASMDTFFRVMIALGIQQHLETLLPDPTIRPIERVGKTGAERKRASSVAAGLSVSDAKPKAWKWGDQNDGE